jgi:DTW domain-containing protein YfiP
MCATCQRPLITCLCRWVTPVVHATDVLILQHPLEAHHAKNTARLLHLSLTRSRLQVGEVFDPSVLDSTRLPVLLYPPDRTGNPVAGAGVGVGEMTAGAWPLPHHVQLVVLDATWRKSRKMLHLNPWLGALPRLSLDDSHPSRYAIRKAHQPGQLSTLEAVCAALARLEGETAGLAPLLVAFGGFVSQAQAFLG